MRNRPQRWLSSRDGEGTDPRLPTPAPGACSCFAVFLMAAVPLTSMIHVGSGRAAGELADALEARKSTPGTPRTRDQRLDYLDYLAVLSGVASPANRAAAVARIPWRGTGVRAVDTPPAKSVRFRHPSGGSEMIRKMSRRGAGFSGADGAMVGEPGEGDGGKPAVGRRSILTRGGVVIAGMVGTGIAAAAAAGPASAASGDAVLQDTVNNAGTSATPTELDASNNTTPTFILTNTGVDTSTTTPGAGPTLRLTPSAESVPTASTVGGDLATTSDGSLYFTHDFPTTPTPTIVAAAVHTEATANVFAPLATPVRIVDTRSTAGRAKIVNASGNLDSKGRLLAGKIIFVNLDSLVSFAEAVFANLTVTQQVGGGYLTLWSGTGSRPITSSINFGATGALANFVASGIAEYSTTILNVVAIYASQTTQVILDVAAFSLPGFEYANVPLAAAGTRASRLQRAQERMRNAKRA
jgi:hypothetical protein